MNFNFNESGNSVTCTFTGRLDTIASLSIQDELTEKMNRIKGSVDPSSLFDGNVVFDMSGVNFIASSFIRICVTSAKQVPKGKFSIVNCDPFLKKTFKIAGLDELLNIV